MKKYSFLLLMILNNSVLCMEDLSKEDLSFILGKPTVKKYVNDSFYEKYEADVTGYGDHSDRYNPDFFTDSLFDYTNASRFIKLAFKYFDFETVKVLTGNYPNILDAVFLNKKYLQILIDKANLCGHNNVDVDISENEYLIVTCERKNTPIIALNKKRLEKVQADAREILEYIIKQKKDLPTILNNAMENCCLQCCSILKKFQDNN